MFRRSSTAGTWAPAEDPKALFEHSMGWLRRHRVLSVLAQQVAGVGGLAE